MDGFFNVYKEKGYTSFDVCNKIKHKFKIKKVGHTGTLDPNAEGVMQVCVGDATKLIPLLEQHDKTYLAELCFGILTKTLDPEGDIIEENDSVPNLNDIDKKILELKEQTSQIPPLYSAIKINGKKAYELARKDVSFTLDARPVKIYEAKRVSDIYYVNNKACVKVLLHVSKGFYVRSFVRDLAQSLNCIAIMSNLKRLKCGSFEVENALKIDELDESKLISIEETFKDYYKYECKDYLVNLIKNGVGLDERQLKIDEPFLVYNNSKLIAIYKPISKYKYKIVKYLGD